MKLYEFIKTLLKKLGIQEENRVDYVCGDGGALPLALSPEK